MHRVAYLGIVLIKLIFTDLIWEYIFEVIIEKYSIFSGQVHLRQSFTDKDNFLNPFLITVYSVYTQTILKYEIYFTDNSVVGKTDTNVYTDLFIIYWYVLLPVCQKMYQIYSTYRIFVKSTSTVFV